MYKRQLFCLLWIYISKVSYSQEIDVDDLIDRLERIERNISDTLNLGTGGVIITAPGDNVDFVSRFFTPRATLLEDPVTGSAHCSLIPYWAKKLNKDEMQAKQLSQRGGELLCHNRGDRVLIGGKARTYLKGAFKVK